MPTTPIPAPASGTSPLCKSGETTSDDRGCSQVSPEIGITSTPVIIRPKTGDPVIYVVAMSKDSSGNYHQRLHALDATTGAELHNGPADISAQYPGTGDNSSGGFVIFDPGQYKERAGLLLIGNTVYLAWASHCDVRPYTGWIMGYNATTLEQTTVLNVTPNGNEGAIWGAGAGMAADASGNIFLLDANGVFDTTLNSSGLPRQRRLRQRLPPPHHQRRTRRRRLLRNVQRDQRKRQRHRPRLRRHSARPPRKTPPAKSGTSPSAPAKIPTSTSSTAPTWANSIPPPTTSTRNSPARSPAESGPCPPPTTNSSITARSVRPSSPSISRTRNCTPPPVAKTPNPSAIPAQLPASPPTPDKNAIVWAAENTNPAVLHAYNAKTLVEIYNTNQAANGRDQFGAGNKFITPMIANGKVYVGTTNGVGVFGLLTDPQKNSKK